MKLAWPYGRHILKPNKLFVAILLAMVLFLSHAQAQSNHSDYKITISAQQIPIKEVIYQIRQQTGLQAFYSNELINGDEKVDVDFRNVKLDKVLKQLFDKKGFYWVYREEAIVLIPKKRFKALTGMNVPSNSTAISISGIVTNEAGIPLPGATVYFKGRTHGATTDANGRFIFTKDSITAPLIVSCVGYMPKTITAVSGKMSIRLEAAISSLDEMVIFGYGSITRRMMTGSISRITGKEIARQPIANPLQALQGTVTGLNVLQVTGLPGSDYRVELRGRNSIGSGNSPLYIVDGVPFPSTPLTWDMEAGNKSVIPTGWRIGFGSNMSYNILNSINPADIESMEVLKDADATAIYGSRGANGVVLINTKKGVAGKPKTTINIYQGIGRLGHYINYLDTEQYLAMRKEAFRNDGEVPMIENAPDLTAWDSTKYTDWQRAMIGGTASITNAQVSVSGGSTTLQYRLSGGYRKETTVYPGSFNYQRLSLRGQLTYASSNQRYKANLFAAYVNDFNRLLSQDLTYFSILPPNAPAMFDEASNLSWAKGLYDNPYAIMLRTYSGRMDNLSLGSVLSAELLSGLELKVNVGFVNMRAQEIQINPLKSYNPAFVNSTTDSYFGNSKLKTWIVEPQLRYQKELGKGKLDVILGATFQQDTRDQQGWKAQGYTDDAFLEEISAAQELEQLAGTQKNDYRYNAAFARVYYGWNSKYLINLTGRRDGSSRFGQGHQFANFGAVGVAWIFTQENWPRRALPFLSFGKLRATYGVTGNDQINNNANLDQYVPRPQGPSNSYLGGRFNPYYGWEKNRKMELGLELGWLKDRMLLRSSYYNNRSSNQIVRYPITTITGTSTVLANVPAVVINRGLELELKTVNIQNRHITWTTTLNLTIPKNKLLEFPGLALTPYNKYFTIGNPLDQFKGFHFIGVDPKTGIAKFEDMDRDGRLTSKDMQSAKSLFPRYYGGLQQSLTYRNWELDLLFQFVGQNGYNYEFTPTFDQAPGFAINQPLSVLKRWMNRGNISEIQQFSQSIVSDAGMAYVYLTNSDKIITDASFLRLKNVNLSYQIPDKWTKRWGIEGSKVYLQGQNLFTITRYPGRDPENAALPNANSYPPLRIWTAGFQLTF